MRQKIQKLPTVLIDRVAAGEVIEAPFSIIKELIENALDASATEIRIETKDGGNSSIFIQDNGTGINPDELELSIERYATSKIQDFEDLDNLHSFGFRGEALAAIASVSHLEIRSRTPENQIGKRIESRGGQLIQVEDCACPIGTSIRVSDLFYTTPARRNYLKNPRTENIRNYKQIIKLALSSPNTHFIYVRDKKEFSNWRPKHNLSEAKETYPFLSALEDRIIEIYGNYIEKYLLEIPLIQEENLQMQGFILKPDYFKANRDMQFQYVNERYVEIENFSYFVKKSYGELLSANMHPCYFLFLEIDPSRVDINVHPQKKRSAIER